MTHSIVCYCKTFSKFKEGYSVTAGSIREENAENSSDAKGGQELRKRKEMYPLG